MITLPRNYTVDPFHISSPPQWTALSQASSLSTSVVTGSKRPLEPLTISLLLPDNSITAPSLVLLVNPSEWTQTLAKQIAESRVRGGLVQEHWGNVLDQITASGVSPGFYVMKDANTGASGLSRFYANESASLRNISSLEILFRNNGYIFLNETPSAGLGPDQGIIDTVGQVLIQFRNYFWKGRFDEFSLSEAADSPFYMSWSFTYTVHEQGPAWLPNNTSLFRWPPAQSSGQIPNQTPNSRIPVQSCPSTPVTSQLAAYQQALSSNPSLTVTTNGGTAQASFDDYQSLIQGTITPSVLTTQLTTQANYSAALNVWDSMGKLLQQLQQSGTSLSDLVSQYDNLTGLVTVGGHSYSVGILSGAQLVVLGEMQ